jgi:hypothetical protein
MFALELAFWAIVILLTVAFVRFRPALLEKFEVRLHEISQHKRFWLAAFGLIVISVRLALLPWIPVPVPMIHDEFSYLLASDTFSHGRLTNPSSPMWEHFESFHVNMLPTYQSMYPPAQGLVLALGQKLTAVPWTGVLLVTAVMCSAIYWMLLGWLPPPWAWMGGALACIRFGIFSYWINSYWGGEVAALGGALVLGALPRLRTCLRAQTGLILAAGLLLLANSRPLEGLLFSLPTLVSGAVITIKRARVTWRGTVKIVCPAMALLAVGAAWMLYYNWRGTGDPLRMPYAINFETYHISRPFFFQKPNPIPAYRHPSMRTFYVYQELPDLQLSKYAAGYLARMKANAYYVFFVWPFLLLIAPSIYAMWRSDLRVVLLSMALLAADLFAQIWPPLPHYAAPATAAVFLALLYSLRHFRHSEPRYGVWGSRAVVLVFAVWMICPIAERVRDPYMTAAENGVGIQGAAMPLYIQRQRIQSELEARAGRHLVIVHYPVHDKPVQEMVYNSADIDHEPVIWARDMGYLKNLELLNYYPDRQVWYVDRGNPMSLLLPYDRVTAPLKLAFDHLAPETNSSSAPNGEHSPSTGTLPDHAHAPAISAVLSP